MAEISAMADQSRCCAIERVGRFRQGRPAVAACCCPRLIAGAAILVDLGNRRAAVGAAVTWPSPQAFCMAIPHVIVDPAFLTAAASTLAAVAEGLAIALVAGTVLGLTDRPQPRRRPPAAPSTSMLFTPCPW